MEQPRWLLLHLELSIGVYGSSCSPAIVPVDIKLSGFPESTDSIMIQH